MEMEFNKDQLLGLARGIGKALYENNQAILKSGEFALSCIDQESKENFIDLLIETAKKIENEWENESYQENNWDLLKGAVYILGHWKASGAIPFLSVVLSYTDPIRHNDATRSIVEYIDRKLAETAAEALQKIAESK